MPVGTTTCRMTEGVQKGGTRLVRRAWECPFWEALGMKKVLRDVVPVLTMAGVLTMVVLLVGRDK